VKLSRVIRMSLRALRRNKARSVLTILGIVIGIAAVIAMMAIGKGSSNSISKTIASMGANNILIMPGQAATGGVSFGAGSTLTLTAEDCQAILRECDAVAAAAPMVRTRSQIIYQDRNWVPQTVLGSTADYLKVREWSDLTAGEPFTETDIRNASRVCLVGQTIVRELFDGESPIGKELRMQNVGFKVVGVLSSKGANAFGQDQDDIVLAPWTTIKFRVGASTTSNVAANSGASSASSTTGTTTAGGNVTYPGGGSLFPPASTNAYLNMATKPRFVNVDQILVAAVSAEQIQQAMQQITNLLHERHRIAPGEPDDFNMRDMTEMANMLASTSGMMTNLLLAVALISLVVGGVGIMNIMLVSVTERTREIGLRMAVGARGNDILRQFLAEAIVLCLLGGLIGFLLGRTVSLLVQQLLRWPVEQSMAAVIAAFAVSAGVGVVFGFYPAYKASRLDPIEALRYE
jgi:ABC-type antimicrobial peptide transport system permease subunit